VSRGVALALALLSTGCGNYYAASAHDAAQGALDTLTGPAANARYAATVATVVQTAGAAARTELQRPETATALTALTTGEAAALRTAVTSTVQTAGTAARAELARIITAEQGRLRQTVRLVIDEALGAKTQQEMADLREALAGAPLQYDIGAAIDSAAPHLAAAVTVAVGKVVLPVQAAADAEAAHWRPIAVGFAVGCALLLFCLVFAAWIIREHQRTIRTLVGQRPPP
jgi:hypothetical protein